MIQLSISSHIPNSGYCSDRIATYCTIQEAKALVGGFIGRRGSSRRVHCIGNLLGANRFTTQ